MRRYIRSHAGTLYFFTLVTHERRPLLTTDLGRRCLRESLKAVMRKHAFRIHAIVLLPDQLHALWELPVGDSDYSTRWRLVKSSFTRRWISAGGREVSVSSSRDRKQERGIWQRRFYEHTCRDDNDVERCRDYIHVNPLKHQLVDRVVDWPWSSFHRYVRQGVYASDWGASQNWYGDEFRHAE